MSSEFDISERLRKILNKLAGKDMALATSVNKKIHQIASCDRAEIEHFKNLRHDLSPLKRVHIGSFVLVFRVDEGVIIFEDFDHHDRIYKKRYIF